MMPSPLRPRQNLLLRLTCVALLALVGLPALEASSAAAERCGDALAAATPAAATPAPATPAAAPAPLTLTFDGTEYVHRWSKDEQHEFTPKGDEDLAKWKNMVTINVHDWAKTGDQLAELANRVLGNYQSAGKIIRTDSEPRTKEHEADHLAIAILGGPDLLEVAFARFLLHEGRGIVIVYSKRFYGDDRKETTSTWFEKDGQKTSEALMAWTSIPSKASLKALPASAP